MPTSGITIVQAFDLLNDVRMPVITQWQIVWDLTEKKLYWKNAHGSKSIAPFGEFSLDDITSYPEAGEILAYKLGRDQPLAGPMELHKCQEIDRSLTTSFENVMSVLGFRPDTDKSAVRSLKKNVLLHKKTHTCS